MTAAGAGPGQPRAARPAGDCEDAARAAALRLLAARERSALEIRRRLRDKGFDPETINRVVGDLQASGLQDDARFAEALVREGVERKGLSSGALLEALARAGVEQDLAVRASRAEAEGDEARAWEAGSRRARSLAGLASDVRVRRLGLFLRRRGYSNEVAERVAGSLAGSPAEREDLVDPGV
ncbi:MAG: RecX family transcriptional regulator [Acidobacteria bacterium]|nr:RecX family transcriptional regulator [Acidobacteriota bacterium]